MSSFATSTGVGLGTAEIVEDFRFEELTSVFLLPPEHPSRATAKITATVADATTVAGMPKPKMRRIAPTMLFLSSEWKDFVFAIGVHLFAAMGSYWVNRTAPAILQAIDSMIVAFAPFHFNSLSVDHTVSGETQKKIKFLNFQ